jgi:hypothetical protein
MSLYFLCISKVKFKHPIMIKYLLISVFTTFLTPLALAQSISSNSPLCTDNSPTLELKASGGSTYAWSGPNNFTSNQQNPTISKATASNAGTYTCVVDGKTSLTTGVKVGKLSSIIDFNWYVLGAKFWLRSYSDIKLKDIPLVYSWSGPNNFSSTEREPFINSYGKENQGTYKLTVKDEFGCIQSSSLVVKFPNSDCPYTPIIYVRTKLGANFNWSGSGSSFSVNVCEGSEFTFSTDTTNWGKKVAIQWFKDDKLVPNATSLEYSTKEIATYYAQISKEGCVYITNKIKAQSSNITPIYIDYSDDKTRYEKLICKKGGSTLLYAYSQGLYLTDETPTYQWYKDGITITKANTSVFNATEEGSYQVKFRIRQCEGVSQPMQVKTVDQIKSGFGFSVGDFIPETQKTLKICSSNNVGVAIYVYGDGNKKIFKDGVLWKEIGSSNNLSVTKQPGTYTLETKQGECTYLDTLKLEYGNIADILVRKESYLSCTNPTNNFYVANTYLTFNTIKWYKNDVLFSSGSFAMYPNSSGVYQGKYEDIATGCKGESEKIIIKAPVMPSRLHFKIIPLVVKKMTICKNVKESLKIYLNDYYSGGTWKKDGKIIDLGNFSNGASISQAGRYWYEYNNGQCTFYSDTLEVIEEELPKITLTQTCLKDNTVRLNVNSISGVKYNWFQNGIALTVKDTTLTVPKGGKYIAEAYRNGCFASSNEINDSISGSEITNLCNGDSLKLKANGDVSSIFSWIGPNNFKSNRQNPIIPKTNKSVQGLYKLSATDKSGCTFNAQTQVTVNDYPAFTLPKTTTVCLGSDFIFNQLISKPLTDSTETVGYYYAVAPNKNTYSGNSYLSNITSKDAGIYSIAVTGSQGGCTVKTTAELIVDASNACKSISVGNNSSKTICAEQTVEIPFKTTGTFKVGTVYRAYSDETYYVSEEGNYKTRKVIFGTGTKSPIKMSGFKSGYNYNVKVESDDGIVSVGEQSIYTNSVASNSVVDSAGYSRNSECKSLPLTLSYNNTYANIQWLLNGDTLKKETGKILTAKKSGKYTFIGIESSGCQASFSKDVVIGKIDKPLLYNRDKVNELSCFNETIYLSTNQYPDAKYMWRRDGILQTAIYSFIDAKTAGKYTVEITKEDCKVNSDTIVIKQNLNKSFNLSAFTYLNRDSSNVLQTYIYVNDLSNGTNKYQLYKDNKLFTEVKQNRVVIRDIGKYFYKTSKGDCEGISNIIDYNGIDPTTNILDKRYLFFNGGYDYSTNTVQLCDTNTVQFFYGYRSEEYQLGTVVRREIVKRKLTAFRDEKPLPAFKDGSNIYPSLRSEEQDYSFYLYFKGAGKYYVIEELTLKDSTKLKFRYDDMTVQLGSQINIGSKIPQNLFSCADSTFISSNTSSYGQRPVGYSWKKDGIVVKKTNANETSSLTVKQSGTYVLETTYKGGCIATSTPLKVELNKMDIVISEIPSLEICDNVAITLKPYINNNLSIDTTKIAFQLVKDGKEEKKGFLVLNGKNEETLSMSFSLKEAGLYSLKVQQGKCQGTSSGLVIKTITVPNTINYTDPILLCQTNSANLKTTEDATMSYLWERDSSFIQDATKASLLVKESGTYRSLNRKASCWNYTPKVKVLANILPTATLTGNKEINYADTAKVSIVFTSHAPWTFKLSDGKEYTATKSPYEVSLRPQFSTNYTLSEVKNVCGTGTVSGTANIKVLVLSSEQEEGVNLNVFPVPTQEDVSIQLSLDKPEMMEWTLTNMVGNTLGSEKQGNKSTKHESNVSLKSLPEGIYFLRIQLGEKTLIRKIIKAN